uniref:hypothetical protein n=1 Tax=Streptococcus suis TaxID=1307 RepID=UPI0005CE5C36
YTQKGSIISTVDLPTTEIIEPFFVTYLKWQNTTIDQALLIKSIALGSIKMRTKDVAVVRLTNRNVFLFP